jgi:hypothetical protein
MRTSHGATWATTPNLGGIATDPTLQAAEPGAETMGMARRPVPPFAPARLLVVALVGASAAVGCVPAPPPPAPPAPVPAEVNAITMPASVDPSGRSDVSAAFAEVLATAPDGATIRLAPRGQYRMERTLLIRQRRDLHIVGNGARIFATTPGDLGRASILVERSAGISITDLTIRGANPHAGLPDAAYQVDKAGQHGITVKSSSRVLIERVTITDTYGDFLYLGQYHRTQPWSEHVTVRNSTFLRNGRQGVAITGARDVLIESSTFSDVRLSTFDFEPLAPGAGAGRVTIRNNQVGPGRSLFVAAEGYGPVNDITIQGNRLRGQAISVRMQDLGGGTRHNWRILGNIGDIVSGNPYGAVMRFFRVDGLEVRGNHQRFDPRRGMVGITASSACNVVVTGNDFPGSTGQGRVDGLCR